MGKSDLDVQINDKPLKALMKAFKGEMPMASIGILGDKNARTGKGATNAEVGVAHEFGTEHMPMRSFLRMPMAEHLYEYLMNAGAFDPSAIKKIIAEKSILSWVKKMAIVAERVVQDAFATGGWGAWAKWKDPKYRNNTGQILIDTQQLRNSITSKVE